MLRRQILIVIGLVMLLPLWAGCGALLGQRYDNFTAYYNTFYNAERAFEREERAIMRADEPIDRTRYIRLFPRPQEGGRGSAQGFDVAIRRAADVLRDHSTSRWVDNALLLIGKSYYYQGNYDASAQKFRELLSLENTRLEDEAYLWLGRALMGSRGYSEAAAALRDGLERDGVRDRWAARINLALAEVMLRQGDLSLARDHLETGLQHIDDRALGARASFLLGQIHDAERRYEDAERAYSQALSLRPTPEVEYAAALQQALAMARGGRGSEAASTLDRMRRSDKYFQQRAEVELTRARVLFIDSRFDEAHQSLYQLLYDRDPNLRIDRVRGRLHYHMGEIYRDHLVDYRRAAAHFDTASAALRQQVAASPDVVSTYEAILDAERLADAFGNYARVRTQLAEMDSLLHLGAMDDETFAETIEAIVEQRRQELVDAERERRRLEQQQGFGLGGGLGGAPGQNGSAVGGEAGPEVPGGVDAGFLGFKNTVRVQESLIAFQARWGPRPHLPNWRRAAAVASSVTMGDQMEGDRTMVSAGPDVGQMSDAFIDISAIPRTEEARQAMRMDRAAARYELGNVLFFTLGDHDAARDLYVRVMQEDADLPISARASYALAELYLSLGDEERAEELFRGVAERVDDDRLVGAARQRVGLPSMQRPSDAGQLATDAYAEAYATWEQGRHADALRGMLEIADQLPGTTEAARARLAAGLIYTDWAVPDTVALLAADLSGLLSPADTLTITDALDDGPAGVGEHLPTDAQDAIDGPPADGIPGELGEPESPPIEPEATSAPSASPASPDGDTYLLSELAAGRPDAATPDTLGFAGPPDVTFGQDLVLLQETPVEEAPVAQEPAPEPWLVTWYAAIADDHPNTPFADRARALRDAILEQQAEYEASLVVDEPPIPAPDFGAVADLDPTLHLEIAFPMADGPTLQYDEASLRSEEPLRGDLGGFTWVVLRTARQFEAQNRMIAFHNRGYRTALLVRPGEAGGEYLVLVGQFATYQEADAARDALPVGSDHRMAEVIEVSMDEPLLAPADLLAPSPE